MVTIVRTMRLTSPLLVSALLLLSATPNQADTPLSDAVPSVSSEPMGNFISEPFPSEPEAATMQQVTSVSQLADVQPTDWAFQALQNLVERYGCIAGYPDGTYRGNRALTRYEFAAGVNACLDRVTELIAQGGSEGVTAEDLTQLQRLQEEFAAELATLRGRVDALEARTAELEANQFSTTTRLEGVALFAAVGATGDEVNGADIDEQIAFSHRTRLNFVTSFTGTDELVTRLQVVNLINPNLNTPEGSLFFAEAAEDASNSVALDALVYRFSLGDRTEVVIAANAAAADDLTSTVNLLDGDGDSGALSTFGTRASIYYLMDNAGLGIRHRFTDWLELSAGYLAPDAFDPSPGAGLFNGPYGALAQLTLRPTEAIEIGLTYINAYNVEPGTGSRLANFRAFTEAEFGEAVPTVTNAYGVEVSWRVAQGLVIGGWAGLTNIRTLSTLNGAIARGDLQTVNWAATLSFPDLLTEGSLGGLIVGMEPRVTDSDIDLPGLADEDEDTSLHIEAFYQYQLTDNIAITPGVIWLTAPDHNDENEDVVIGTIRTTFSF